MPIPLPKEIHDHEPLIFPEGFVWGAATSAHQVEGNNIHNDWWEWEERVQPPLKRSGIACNHYELFEEDFELVKSLGHNAHRLSIEWSRIEPEEGLFSDEAIQHYVEVLKSLKAKKMTVMLTLHHFTTPLWLAQKGGWENRRSAWYFERFVKKIVPAVKEYVDLWCTINEPGVYVYTGFIEANWPPQHKSNWAAFRVMWNMAQAHKRAYKAIHALVPKAQVGIAQNFVTMNRFHKHSVREGIAETVLDLSNNHPFYILTGKNTHDFLGLNYYQNRYISFNGESRVPKFVDIETTKKDVSDLGWEVYPQGLYEALMDLSDFHKPIYITENGLATTNDDRRVRFLLTFLKEIYHAIQSGVKVKGYFFWSLMDNFEWGDGFEPRFGLVQVDYQDPKLKRTPRPSAYVYKDIIDNNGIRHELLKLLGHGIRVEEVLKSR